MAISSTLSLNNQAAVAKSFELVRTFPNGNDRLLVGSTTLNPMVLAIRHFFTPAKGTKLAFDRHLVTFTNTFYDSEEREVVVNSTLSTTVPRHLGVTDVIMQDSNAFVRNAWSANLADLLLGKS